MFSYRFFRNFCWDLLPEAVLRNFFESCIKLAKKRNQPSIETLFQCLMANHGGRKFSRDSSEYTSQIEMIDAAFHKNKPDLKEDRFVFMFCFELIARFHFNNAQNRRPTDLPPNDLPSLPENKELRLLEKVAETYILKKRGNISKLRANKQFGNKDEKYEEYMCSAKSLYREALSLSKNVLGDHELTCALYKLLGDLCFNWNKNDEALIYYADAVNLPKKLKLNSNGQFVMLLKNFGECLSINS